MREVQVVEAVLMEDLSVPACASEPSRDGGLRIAQDPFCSGRVQPFSQREIRTIAIWCEGVFRRYRAVLRLEVKVVRQA